VPPEVASGRSDELLSLLAQEESAKLEFKGSFRYDQQTKQVSKDLERIIAKSVAGLLNSRHGGTLLIGVQDHEGDDGLKEVFGLEKDYSLLGKGAGRDEFELKLTDTLVVALGVSVMAFVTVSFHDFDGKDVCLVSVEPSDHPVYTSDGSTVNFHLRTGNSTKPLPLPEVTKYVQTRWG
jgi:predicted HTH transcriptional regulator